MEERREIVSKVCTAGLGDMVCGSKKVTLYTKEGAVAADNVR